MGAKPAATSGESLQLPALEWTMTTAQGEGLGQFLAKGVTRGTRSAYAADWRLWSAFVGKIAQDGGEGDVYLEKSGSDRDRAVMLALFFKERYETGGMRGRQATAVSAGIRHHFATALKPVHWFDSQIVTNARAACKMTCDELRGHKREAKGRATLPVSEDMIMAARVRLWEGKSWGWGDVDDRMTYMGLMWGFDQVARVSEYTSAEPSAEDHCVRVWQLTFVVEGEMGQPQRLISGSLLAQEMRATPIPAIMACEVEASSHKSGVLRKKKVIGRRSEEESQWLDDLTEWLLKSDLKTEDQIFTRYKAKTIGGKVYMKRLSAEMIRTAVKDMAIAAGLPPNKFSSHSLRKGGMSQMRGLGASADDRRDRGNYADGSSVGDTIYDYSVVALGPLACNMNLGLCNSIKPTTEHVGRCLPLR